MLSFGPHLSSRLRAAALVAGAAAAAALARPSPPPRTLEGLAASLSREVGGGAVEPGDIVWEPAGSLPVEAVFGRRVLFLVRSTLQPRLRDVHRASVRVTPEGQPIEVRNVRNLTRTPLLDEAGLLLKGSLSAHATLAAGRVLGLTILDLRGPSEGEQASGSLAWMVGRAACWAEQGSLTPVGRSHVTLKSSARSVRIALDHNTVRVELDDPDAAFAVEPGRDGIVPRGSTSEEVAEVGRPANRGRSALPWLRGLLAEHAGSAAADFPFRATSAVRDGAWRLGSFALGFTSDRRLSVQPEPRRSGASGDAGEQLGVFPRIPSLWQTARPGEGRFVPVTLPWLPRSSPEPAALPYFHTTYVRPDPARPFASVHLVALDLRQVALHLTAGYERPRPSAALPGTGRIPETDAPHVVAAFAVAPGAGGGFVGVGRTLVPPAHDLATWVVTRSGRNLFGEWGSGKAMEEETESLLQGASFLSADGSTAGVVEQSALCVTREGHAYYAWSGESTQAAFAGALQSAGCQRGLRLTDRPGSAGFAFFRANAGKVHSELAHPAMGLRPLRFLTGSEDAFVYATLRTHDRGGPGGARHVPSAGAQPPPLSLPGIFEVSRKLGDLEVRLISFDPGRVDWVLRAGRDEPSAAGARPKKVALGPTLLPRSLAAIGLGHTTDALRYGLVFEGQPSLDLRRGYATLVLRGGEPPRILAPGEAWSPDRSEEAVQVPLLSESGKLLPSGSDRGPMRQRGALCVAPGGRTVVALARHDSSDPLVSTLLDAGCARVVGLDRGSRHAAFVHRAGTDLPPADAYGATVLHALSRPMSPPAGFL